MKNIVLLSLLVLSFNAGAQDFSADHIKKLNRLGVRTADFDLNNPVIRKDFQDILRFNTKERVNGVIGGSITAPSAILIILGSVLMFSESTPDGRNMAAAIGEGLIYTGAIGGVVSIPFWKNRGKNKKQKEKLLKKYHLKN